MGKSNHILLENVKEDLRNNGFALMKDFITSNSEFIDLKIKFMILYILKLNSTGLQPLSILKIQLIIL